MSTRRHRRASRLTLLYPRSWRRRFPDFEEVVSLELAAHPRRATVDVVLGAVVERCRAAGLLPAGPADRARSGLGLVCAVLVPFAALTAGMWSQLRTGLAVAPGGSHPTLQAADVLLAVGAAALLGALVGALVLVATRGERARRRPGAAGDSPRRRPLGSPALAFAGSMGVLSLAGWAADASGWYSPAAAALPAGGPGHLLTLWVRGVVAAVTPAWVHPGIWGRLPAGDLFATLVAPVASVVAVVALLRVATRLPAGVPGRADATVAVGALAAMCCSLAAAARWLLTAPAGPGFAHFAPGHAAWAVLGILAVLTTAAGVGTRRVLTARHRPATGRVAGR